MKFNIFLQTNNKKLLQVGCILIFMSGLILFSTPLTNLHLFHTSEKEETVNVVEESIEQNIVTDTYNTLEVSHLGNVVDTQSQQIDDLNDSISILQNEINTLKLELSIQTIKGISKENENINRELFVAYANSYVGKIPYLWGGKPICRGYDGNQFGTEIKTNIEPNNIETNNDSVTIIEEFNYEDYLEYIVYVSNRDYDYTELSEALSLYYSLGYNVEETFLEYLNAIEYENVKELYAYFDEFLEIYNQESITEEIVDQNTSKIKGLDCSGFVEWVYWSCFDIDLKTLSTEKICDIFVPISKDKIQIGDLGLLFEGGSTDNQTNHVGIYAGVDENGNDLWIHCNTASNNVSIDNFDKFTVFYSLF